MLTFARRGSSNHDFEREIYELTRSDMRARMTHDSGRRLRRCVRPRLSGSSLPPADECCSMPVRTGIAGRAGQSTHRFGRALMSVV